MFWNNIWMRRMVMMREYEGYWLKKGTVLNKKYAILGVIDEGGI